MPTEHLKKWEKGNEIYYEVAAKIFQRNQFWGPYVVGIIAIVFLNLREKRQYDVKAEYALLDDLPGQVAASGLKAGYVQVGKDAKDCQYCYYHVVKAHEWV